jgi:Type I phosphodiesterase / nucleotide pyrophosphatase
MALDDLFLRVQRAIDRMVRRLRLGAPPVAGRRRLLIVQIDGLSRAVLEQALARGDMPVLRRLLDSGGHRLSPMTVGIPTSTPAFHMATMYGVQPDIPGFHYHDKRRRTDIHFPRAGHAAFVEASQAANRPGILQGGSVYGCAFTGGAEHDFFSFARLTRPRAPGLVRVLSAFVLVAWVAAKSAALTAGELVPVLGRIAWRPSRRGSTWRSFKKKIVVSVWTRQWFTFAVARDIYDGVPAIYVNYLDHDEAAHAFGPRSRQAFSGLRAVDRSLRQIRRALRRVDEHCYDLYVLADHGQASCTPYSAMTGGRRFEHAFFDEILAGARAAACSVPSPGSSVEFPASRAAQAMKASEAGSPSGTGERLAVDFEPYLDVREAWEREGIRVVSAGPNAFVYFVDTPEPVPLEAIEARCPGLPALLSQSAGVGFVLARAKDGPVCFWRGHGYRLADPEGGPFGEREDRTVVLRDLTALMAMPNAGDLVVYGIDAPDGHVSFIDEIGAHAGPSPEELHTFVVAPSEAGLPALIDHPLRLYELFIRYQSATPPGRLDGTEPRSFHVARVDRRSGTRSASVDGNGGRTALVPEVVDEDLSRAVSALRPVKGPGVLAMRGFARPDTSSMTGY